MYIFSFNIKVKEQFLSQYPVILINNDLREIINEIRRMISDEFYDISITNNIPIVDFILSSTIMFVDNNIILHNKQIRLSEIKETINLIKNKII